MNTQNNFTLFPPQEEVLQSGLLDAPKHLLLNMATGAGKTYLSELAIEKIVQGGYKAVYLTPLKALASQQRKDWSRRFPGIKIGEFTGDTLQKSKSKYSYQEALILIMTPERMDACLRNWRRHWDWIPDISLVVIDEFHLLGQGERGARLEGTMTRLIRLNPFLRFIGLSATMPNCNEIAAWLHGDSYQSSWRQIPLEKKFVRFKDAKAKPQLMFEEVSRCIQEGGQSLIFCNSRKRTEELCAFLKSRGIPAACHHAGLMLEQREKVEADFRTGLAKALVATSTLEMGLNTPARQVILYDTYAFASYGFQDLPVWSYMQRAGRAGRPGLDQHGEAVMLLPKWVSASKYKREECEPITSQIGGHRYMQEQILIDVYAGYSRTTKDLTDGFLPLTLYKAQHQSCSIDRQINDMLSADLLYETDTTEDVKHRPLKVGLLGKLSVRLMFTVETVQLVKAVYSTGKRLFLFDILLMATLCADCEPILRLNREEIDNLCEIVQALPSTLLDCNQDQLNRILPGEASIPRLLAAIKMAAICHCLTTELPIEEISRRFMVYAADIHLLRDNTTRILQGIEAIISSLDKKELGEEDAAKRKANLTAANRLAGMLKDMIQYRLSSDLVSLTQLHGVGGQRARALADEGFDTIESIAEADQKALQKTDGIGKKLATQLIRDAKALESKTKDFTYTEPPVAPACKSHKAKSNIDLYRLKRSTELFIAGQENNAFLVRGGREDHIIRKNGTAFSCDCMDFQTKGGSCKHILCVKRELGDTEVAYTINNLQKNSRQAIRERLPDLWYSITTKEE